jgi:hypothetical protein
MRIAFKNELKLSEAKKVVAEFKTGTIKRVGADCASLTDSRKRNYTLCFKSNLELKKLINKG